MESAKSAQPSWVRSSAFDDLTEVGSGLVGTTYGRQVWWAHRKWRDWEVEDVDRHLQDTFGLDDMKPSGDLLADADKCQWEAKLRKFGLMRRQDFSTVSFHRR